MSINSWLSSKLQPYGRFRISFNIRDVISETDYSYHNKEKMHEVLSTIGWTIRVEKNFETVKYYLQKLRTLIPYGIPTHNFMQSFELLKLWGESKHKTSCGYYSMVLVDIMNSIGIPCRQIAGWVVPPFPGISYSYIPAHIVLNHLMCEVYIDGKWLLVDPTEGSWYEDDNGNILSAVQIHQRIENKLKWKSCVLQPSESICYQGLFAYLILPLESEYLSSNTTFTGSWWKLEWLKELLKDKKVVFCGKQTRCTNYYRMLTLFIAIMPLLFYFALIIYLLLYWL